MAYDASQNEVFFARIGNFARELQGAREEALRLDEFWTAEGVSSDPDFVAVDANTTAEVTDMIVLAQAFQAFFNNEAVATADRKVNLTPFLGN